MKEGQRDGDRPKTGERDGMRKKSGEGEGAARTGPRDGEGTKKTGERDGDKPKTGARDGERPRTGERDGDKPKTGERDGERPRTGERDGERPKTGERDGERKQGAREGEGGRSREGADANSGSNTEGDTIAMKVTADGKWVLVAGEKVPWNRLRGHLQKFLAEQEGTRVIITGETGVSDETLNEVRDAVRDNGVKNATISADTKE